MAEAERRRLEWEELAKSTPYYTSEKGIIIYNKAEVAPLFIGGNKAMMKYLRDNIEFPKDAQDKGLEATIFVDFIVGADGTVRDVAVKDTPGEDSDLSFRTEAIRVVKSMPKWVAGSQNGKPVNVKFSLPVTFQLM